MPCQINLEIVTFKYNRQQKFNEKYPPFYFA